MRTEVSLEDAIGKVLERVVVDGYQAVLTFSDGTFTTLGIDLGYEHGDETIIPTTLRWHSFQRLIEAGIMSKDEIQAERRRIQK